MFGLVVKEYSQHDIQTWFSWDFPWCNNHYFKDHLSFFVIDSKLQDNNNEWLFDFVEGIHDAADACIMLFQHDHWALISSYNKKSILWCSKECVSLITLSRWSSQTSDRCCFWSSVMNLRKNFAATLLIPSFFVRISWYEPKKFWILQLLTALAHRDIRHSMLMVAQNDCHLSLIDGLDWLKTLFL